MQDNFRVILRIGFNIITAMIVQNTIFTTSFVRIDSFDSWTFSLGEAEKKNYSNAYRGTVLGNFRVILRVGFNIITTMIVQKILFTTSFVRIDSFDS